MHRIKPKTMIACFFENNHKAFLRHVTVDALMVRRDEILLVKRAPQQFVGNKYALPGGFLDREETARQAVLRELLEETGYKARLISIFRINDNPYRIGEDRQNVDFVYLVEVEKKVGKPNQEIGNIRWFKLNKLPDESEFAFDHYETIQLYLRYKKKPFKLPYIG